MFLNIEKILDEVDLSANTIVADFGCGSGGWVISLAKLLVDGRVFAIDVLEEPLSALKSRAQTENLLNLETIRADVESKDGSGLGVSSVDMVLMTNLLFECKYKNKVFEEAKKVLKSGGRILVVDWRKDAVFGPEKGRISAEQVKELADKIEFKFVKEIDAGKYHYALIFKKL